MSGKGSGRRPQLVTEDEAAANWARIFGKGRPESQRVEISCPKTYSDAMRAYEAATAYSMLWGKGWDPEPSWPRGLPAYKVQAAVKDEAAQ